MRKLSLPSFAAGAVAALVLVGLPAAAVVSADLHPSTYDGTTPTLMVAPIDFAIGQSIDAAQPDSGTFDCGSGDIWNSTIPMRMRWTGSDSTSGIASYDVWEEGPGTGLIKAVSGTSSTSYAFSGSNYWGDCGGGQDTVNSWWVSARDNRGNLATSSITAFVRSAQVYQETGRAPSSGDYPSLALTKAGTWSVSTCTCDNHGQDLYSTTAGAALTYTVTTSRPGQTVAVVAGKNTNRGAVKIGVDGGTAAAVDTYASTPTHRVIVWQKTLDTPGKHTVKVTNAGTAGRSRVDIDSILLTNQRSSDAPEPAVTP